MKTPEGIFEILKAEFSDSAFEILTDEPTESIITVEPLKIHKVCEFLRDQDELLFDVLMNLSGVDDANGKKVINEEGNESVEGHTLSVYYHLDSIKLKHKVTLKVSADINKPEVESVENVWKCADWHEREAYDMFGIKFLNHPNLIRILMPYDWEEGSHPLRKDYVSPEYYNGMKIPY